MMNNDFIVKCNEESGQIESISLFGSEMLEQTPLSELLVNDVPLKLRAVQAEPSPECGPLNMTMKGERFVNQFSGWGLVLTRHMGSGSRVKLKHSCFGINYWLRREQADATCPCPGPGGPVVEAPLFLDTLSLLNLNWRFWGEDTHMIFPSLHSIGPTDEFGHVGYDNDTPENCKRFMQNVWRRLYPGVMAIHGGVYYNKKTGEWLAVTCRDSHISYILNIENAGRGVSYDFKFHSEIKMNELIRLPEIKIYYGKTQEEMHSWMADYITHYYEEPPEWAVKTAWSRGLVWDNQPTWAEQADFWLENLKKRQCNGVSYSLVTDRPIDSGTAPKSYKPDPNHGTVGEFKEMCLKLKENGIPLLIWMSHSGIMPGAAGVDDDWFVRGIDGQMNASWGNRSCGMFTINPGHPGYIEYTKKWISFYIEECGAKGIFMDCLGWAFPPDFAHRDFMRYPADTNVMVIKFMNEIYAHIKKCDSEAILLGEGTTLEAPVNIFSIHANPIRAVDGMGPRDFILSLNKYGKKKMVIDQAPDYMVSAGLLRTCDDERYTEYNKYLTDIIRSGRRFEHAPVNLSVLDNLIVVPLCDEEVCVNPQTLARRIDSLTEVITGRVIKPGADGSFNDVEFGIYKITNS